ncbi:uncharacterized protein METZ01_LOCUS476852, partial [marine metagenome]
MGVAPAFSSVSTFHVGTNLIPYPYKVSQTIEDAIPPQYFSNILEIAGSGNSKKYINGHWYGSLNFFVPSETYWFSVNNSIEFAFNEPSDIYNDTTSDSRGNTPELFTFNQSIYQAFYFIETADIAGENLVDGEDWIGAFYGDVCIGSRVWNESYTDIPVMGFDEDSPETQGYIVPGEYPRFVVYDASEDTYYDAFTTGNHIFEETLLAMYIVNNISVKRDCDGELGASEGEPYLDDCEICVDE